MFRKGVSLYSLCGERLQIIAYRWEGRWLAILRIPNLKALKKKYGFISRDSVGGSLLHGVGWHKGSWKMQMSSFIRRGAGADCWLAVPSCETSRSRLRVLTRLHSKHTGESCRSVMAEPWKLQCHIQHILVAKGVIRPALTRGERKRTPFNGKSAKELQPCLTTTVHSLSTNLHSHAYKACSPSPQVPAPQSFSPLRHQVQASNPGSCHLNQVLNAMRQCP